MARDKRAVAALEAAGFFVLTIWECDAEDPVVLSELVRDLVQTLRKRVS